MKFLFFKKSRGGNQKGFSLVEMIIYMALLVILLATIVTSILSLTTHYRAVKNTREIEDSGIAVLDRMTRDIRNADGVLTDVSIFNVSPGTLTLVSTDSTTGISTTTMFRVESERVVVYENSVLVGPLTKNSVDILGFTIRHIDTPNADAIKIELSMQSDHAAPNIISRNFYSTVVLRGTYR